MTKIIRKDNENLPRVLKNWAPILEKSFGENLNDNLRKEVSLYCEKISMESTMSSPDPGSSFRKDIPLQPERLSEQGDVIKLLPSSIRVLSKINLDDKNIFTMEGPRADVLNNDGEVETIYVGCVERRVKVNFDDLLDFEKLPEPEELEPVKDLIIEDLIDYINSQLKYYDTIAIYKVIDSIMLIKEHSEVLLRSRILFLDRNDETSPMYIVDTDENGSVISCKKSENLSDDFIKATTDNGKSYWVDQSGEEDKIMNNIFSEKEVNDMINLYKSNMNILQSNITILNNSII